MYKNTEDTTFLKPVKDGNKVVIKEKELTSFEPRRVDTIGRLELKRNEEVKKLREKAISGLNHYIRYKVKDKVQVAGLQIPYSDFTDFVEKDGLFAPAFFNDLVEPPTELINNKTIQNGTRIDMTPFLCVGFCELLAAYIEKGKQSPDKISDMYGLLDNIFCTLDDYKRIRKELLNYPKDEDDLKHNQACILFSMTSTYIDYRFEWIREYSSILYVLSMVSPKDFISVLLKLTEELQIMAIPFYVGIDRDKHEKSIYSSVDISPVYRTLTDRALTFKRIGYMANGKKNYITDCRGVCIYSALLFIYTFVSTFGERRNIFKKDLSSYLDGDQNQSKENEIESNETEKDEIESTSRYTKPGIDGFSETLKGCIGNDFIGRYLSTGRFVMRKTTPEFEYYVSGHMRATNTGKTDINGVPKEQHENEILFRKAFCVQNTVNYDKQCKDDTGIHYFTESYLCQALEYFVNDAAIVDKSDYERTVREKDATIRQLTNENTRLLNSNKKKEMNPGISTTDYENAQKQIEDQEKRIKELEYQLALKADQMEILSTELNDTKSRFQNMFTYEGNETDEPEANDISIEEMVSILNEFRFLMIGGRNELLGKLAEFGWTNIQQVSHENTTAVTSKADFFCINTRFVAHKLVHMVESAYSNQKDQIFYYNGTNTTGLIRVCYEFVTDWLNK